MTLLLRNVEVDEQTVDVRIVDDRIAEIGAGLGGDGAEVIDGAGGALLPGLHDHHIHLLALAAALRSVDCSPSAVGDLAGLGRALRSHPGPWVRGTGYHESVAGELNRDRIDQLLPDRPVRIQHRSGALWMLNSAALQAVSPTLDQTPDVERDASGMPTGRLWRYDARLRAALPDDPPDIAAVATTLIEYGITSATDATPDVDASAVDVLAALPQRITLLGAAEDAVLPPRFAAGPRKIMFRDHDPPAFDDLRDLIAHTHRRGRPVAVHCVTRQSLLLTLAALEDAGAVDGDRIEHASVVPTGVSEWLARLGVRVVTQPGFLRARGDDYLRDVSTDDVGCLYPCKTLRRAGVPVALSSDAPYGPLDPWAVMRSAVERTTATGHIVVAAERLSAREALSSYLGTAADPGGAPRRVTVGAQADLCLLHVPLRAALGELDHPMVRTVVMSGTIIRQRKGSHASAT